jgi:hypothetical protein
MTTTVFHQGPAYELSVTITRNWLGHHLRLQSLVPTARRPGQQLRFESVLSTAELRTLHAALGQSLAASGGEPGTDLSSSSPDEPVTA